VRPPQLDELPNLVAQAALEKVVVEDAGGAGVRQDVGVPLLQAVAGEGPVLEGGAGVVVVNEGDRAAGPHANHARRLPLHMPTMQHSVQLIRMSNYLHPYYSDMRARCVCVHC
jgi:hypothetical protein